MEKSFEIELKAFGNRLKALRIAKGMSQLDLEVESGINRTEISRIENGQRNLEFYTIVKLANSLKIALKEFFN